ncbi:hypothetical protein ESN35_06105 [Bifidobacterium pullorum subsp. gallinarum]|uniref:Uncharacterized protein n=1 Tax=Bifidobacterium pullorum subsp. gallinarum TaxID=78344 RepID=A0A4P6DSR4_9BIFI|nr:hypothetical protein [Bifidobacterium pullorum]QAY33021.1 hypothetical protein ESN35_06105 [Bifidobacterium pullorum subsp. gallinarum]
MFMKKQFNVEIDHETVQRVRDKCGELGVGIGHLMRCIIVPDDVEALYGGDDLSFSDIPRPTTVHRWENINDGRITMRMSETEHEILTRRALREEMTRSELMRILVTRALEDPSLDAIAEQSEWQVERRCRELLNTIRDRKERKQ